MELSRLRFEQTAGAGEDSHDSRIPDHVPPSHSSLSSNEKLRLSMSHERSRSPSHVHSIQEMAREAASEAAAGLAEREAASEHASTHTPSWQHPTSLTPPENSESDKLIPESSHRHSHPVRLATQIVDEETQSDKEVGHLADEADNHFVDLGGINEDIEESSILEDIERKVRFGGLGSGGGSIAEYAGFGKTQQQQSSAPPPPADRGRSSSMIQATMDLFARARAGRKNSLDSNEYVGFDDVNGTHATGFRLFLFRLRATVQYLTPGLQRRINAYLLVLFLIVISLVARGFDAPRRLFILYICTVLLEFGCSVLDRVVYKLIDVLFETRFDVAYQLHSLNGPLGMIITILVVRNYWHLLAADEILPHWKDYVTAAAVFVICLCAKNWLGRRQYVYLLERRFTDKVESLNSMIIILSELASTRPPKSVQLLRASTLTAASALKLARDNIKSGKTEKVVPGEGHAPGTAAGKLAGAKAGLNIYSKKVMDVFEEMVEPTAEESTEEALTKKELYARRRSFWQSAARLSNTSGVMKVITYNGVVTISSQEQAKQFGNKLYRHLSKGNKVVVTPELIHKLFDERKELVRSDENEKVQHEEELANIASAQASKAMFSEHEEEKQALWSVAVGLFDPFNLGRISEDFCTEAVVTIYKEQRFTAASINDFGELHQSLRLGIDIVYWIIMLFVLQSIFGFDLTTYLLPFITLLLTVSFAIAPLVGNIFLAFAFVFFMAPYDIGNKVQFGLYNLYTPPVIGYIKSVTLLYTVVTTTRNETVKIPNHTLYSERIYNLTETSGAVHEFIFHFNVFNTNTSDMEKIHLFFQRLKHFTLRESKEWKSFLVCAQGFNMVENNMEFRVYATHRENWHFYKAVSAARIEFFAAIKRLREELGITFLKATQPVNLITEPAETGSHSAGMASGSSSPVRRNSGDFVDAPFSNTGTEGVVNRFSAGVHQAEYDRSKELSAAAELDGTDASVIPTDEPFYFHRMNEIFREACAEMNKPIEECKCPSVILYLYQRMDPERRKEYHQSIIVCATLKEMAVAKKHAAKNKVVDYSQSFGGTAADTKNEKEAAAILRGETGVNEEEEQNSLYPLLARPNIEHSYDQQQLRRYGKWGKVMGGTGCYLYLHYLTKEVVSIRPEDFEEEPDTSATDADGGAEEVKDPANGLRRVDLADLQQEVERIVSEGKKTPLLLDTSKSGAVRAFYTYKGLLEDVSPLTVPFGKSGVKKEDVMERCRAKLVAALKTGATFALYMGDIRIEHADFKNKLCKKDVFPKEVFQSSGAKLLQPEYEPKYKAIYREADLEAGQAIARDGFRAVVISTLDPYEYEAALSECIPLGYMEPIYVNPAD